MDFPGGPVVKNLSADAGDTSLVSGPRKIAHATGQQAHVQQLLTLRSPPQKKDFKMA